MVYSERSTCRACEGKLKLIWALGEQHIISLGDKEDVKVPLTLMKCAECHLVQLKETVDPDTLYRQYYYRSGTTQTMRNHLKGIVDAVRGRIKLGVGDIVVDIGSNDGTLLGYYPRNVVGIGFEPSENVGKSARGGNILVHNFFSAEGYETLVPVTKKQAKVITAIAMFYDVDNPNKFLQDVKKVLAPDGLFIIEVNYLPDMLKNNAVDMISHEHLCYYSLHTLDGPLEANDLQIFDVEFSDINGGVFRAYIRHRGSGTHPIIVNPAPWETEDALHLDTMKPYFDFRDRVKEIAYKLHTFIPIEKYHGKKTYVLGASTRGYTILQLADLDHKSIDFAVERDERKVGKVYGSSGIPIISEAQASRMPPDYSLVMPYFFRNEIIQREWDFLQNGGKLLFPLPEPYLVGIEKI